MSFPILTLTLNDPAYPAPLKEISDAPSQLFVRGNVDALSHPCCVAVVGTRRCSPYGAAMTTRISGELAARGACIVSGLALGVDTAAHTAALTAGGATIAVLGCGISDMDIYPASNGALARRILESGGAIVSEYEVGTPPYPSHFLDRNRIIAALSRGTLVTEAPIKSGALATARRALEYNRDVYAVPGEITSYRSAGTNNLIKQGALCVTQTDDILDTIESIYLTALPKHGTEQALPENEQAVIDVIRNANVAAHFDVVLSATGLDAGAASSAIIALTLSGAIQETEPNTYSIVSP